jgi:FAD/FMN-containing dehydrogenase/Fe-S oxidoreductase
MDLDQTRVQDDLRGIIEGDVFFGDLFGQMYATDASIYQQRPFGVVRPRSTEDVAAVVRYAAEHSLSVHARGAGSSLAGESLGRGIILDFSRYMRRWRLLDEHRVRVQPGVVLATLNRELRGAGRLLGPDPATRSVTTLGSVIAQDASGSHFLRYGSARDCLHSLQVVSGSGEVLELSASRRAGSPSVRRIENEIERIGRRYADHLPPPETDPAVARTQLGKGGYGLFRALRGERPDLQQLVAGSEGALALITEATLETEPLPPHRGVVLLFFRKIEAAARGALVATAQGAVACDLMDRRLLEIARETDRRYDHLIPREAEAMVLAELQGVGLPELRDRLRALAAEVCETQQLAFAVRMTTEPSERDNYWRLSRRVIPRLYRLKGSSRPLPFVEDMAVTPQRLPGFLLALQNLLKRHQVTATLFAHAGHGQVHLRPFLDLSDPTDQRRIVPLAEECFATLQRFGGRVAAAQGAGLSRTALLRRQLGPLWPAMLEVKRAFDPAGTLNPGKFITSQLPRADRDLRNVVRRIALEVPGNGDATVIESSSTAPTEMASSRSSTVSDSAAVEAASSQGSAAPTTEPEGRPGALPVLQVWPVEASLERVARECNGCGRCRTTAPTERMCPVFRAIPSEEASPRAKANLMRAVLTGELPAETLVSDEMKEVADLCFHCHQCRLECPASVDIPKLSGEIKGHYVATNGLPLRDLWFCRLDTIAAVASLSPIVANWVAGNAGARWLLERTLGVSRARKIPRFANRSFMRWAVRRRLTRMSAEHEHRGAKAVYFVDQYANYHDPQLGRALVEVMKHNNIDVYVPPKQVPCGMTMIAAGDLKGARKRAEHNIRVLADAVRSGYDIVATEPTAALCLSHEYLHLCDSEDARLVAAHTFEACRYLWNRHCQNELALDFRPIHARVAYHQPCHVRAIDHEAPGPQLMRLLPRLNVETVDKGCTGMAGTWGWQKKNYRNSLRIGWPLLSAMKKSPARTAATECSACKMQIEHGSGVSTLHPIKLMAYAYGHLPELGATLGARS